MKTEHITLEDAEKMAQLTDYAWIAVEEPGSEINWADAGAFYLEGFNAGYEEGQSSSKIKQLEWEDIDMWYFKAKTSLGLGYSITEIKGTYIVHFGGAPISWEKSLESAKAAAQADFEKRIKECLE